MRVQAIVFYPPLPPGAYVRRPAEHLPYPLGRSDCVLFSRGRHAIWQAARTLGIGAGDVVLAPAWHHGAEIEALRRAGAEVAFYEPNGLLEPDEPELDALVGENTRALVLTHFLGFPQDGARWRDWCDERGLLLIEDAAHACLARDGTAPTGSHGHAAVWCLFKSFALPDGAALRIEGPVPETDRPPALGAVGAARGHAYWLLGHAPGMAAVAARTHSNGDFDLHAEIRLGDPGTPPSSTTRFLLPRLADEAAAARRRANYALLLDELSDQVPEPFTAPAAGAVPLGFPLDCARKRAMLHRLWDAGIDAVDFWSVPHPLLPAGRFPATQRRRESTVVLPVHQELRARDLELMADAARARARQPRPLAVEFAGLTAELREEWAELARRARSVFATPEWAETWCAHFLRDRPLRLVVLRDASARVVAVLPLYVRVERPLKILRIVGHGPGEALGPVCDPRDRPRVARALPRVLSELGAQALLVDHADGAAGWSGYTRARVLRSEASPVVRFDSCSWEAFMAARSRRLRKELRRQERLLDSQHGLRYRLGGSDPERLGEELEAVFRLHEARWREGGSRFVAQLPFHRDFAKVACRRGWLRLWLLEAGGRPLASAYGFRYEGVEFDYQGGRDPDWHGPAAGLVLLGRQIRTALEDGVSEFRLCRGDAWFKQRFATDHPGLETLMLSRGPAAAALAAAGAALPEPVSGLVKRRLAA